MEWNRTWQGFVNISKCKHLSIGDTSNVRSYTLTIDSENVTIQQANEECDLGITFTNDLSFLNILISQFTKPTKCLV